MEKRRKRRFPAILAALAAVTLLLGSSSSGAVRLRRSSSLYHSRLAMAHSHTWGEQSPRKVSGLSPSFFFVCPTIHRKRQNPTKYFLEIAGTENACPRSGEGGQAFVVKLSKGHNLFVVFHYIY